MTRRTVPAAETGRRNQSPAILRLNPGRRRTALGRSHLRADMSARA